MATLDTTAEPRPAAPTPAPVAYGASVASPGAAAVERDAFASSDFDVAAFVAQHRAAGSLPRLADSLHAHLDALKSELVELINRDYADFVRLSADMVGLDRVVRDLRAPLTALSREVQTVRDDIKHALERVSSELGEKMRLAQQRQTLHLFIRVAESVEHVEKLLDRLSEDGEAAGDDAAACQVMERAASEVHRLRFQVEPARGYAFVGSVIERVQSVEHALGERLGRALLASIRAGDEPALAHCLRAFKSLQRVEDAEALVAREVVTPRVRQLITSADGKSHAAVEAMFDRVLRFVRDECLIVVRVSTRVSLRVLGFRFLTRAIFVPLANHLTETVPTLFNYAIPGDFHVHYSLTHRFLRAFEAFYVTVDGVRALRDHRTYRDLQRRWNVAVYFQMRFKAITARLQAMLHGAPQLTAAASEADAFHVAAVQVLWEVVCECWAPEVVLEPVAHRFFKLTLQLVHRLRAWVRDDVPTWSVDAAMFAHVHHDVGLLCTRLPGLVESHIVPSGAVPAALHAALAPALAEEVEALRATLPGVLRCIETPLVSACYTPLTQCINGIPAQYRLTNRPMPTRPSLLLPDVLAPLRTRRDTLAAVLDAEAQRALCTGVASALTERFVAVVGQLLDTVRKQDDSLRRLQGRASAGGVDGGGGGGGDGGGGGGGGGGGVSDVDKICAQLVLDVGEYGRMLGALGVDTAQLDAYSALRKHAAAGIK